MEPSPQQVGREVEQEVGRAVLASRFPTNRFQAECIQASRIDETPARAVRALLFADVHGYSRLSERECLSFRRFFGDGVARDVLAPRAAAILEVHTWGDALHIVMDDLVEAGRLALDLQAWLARQDWSAAGLTTAPRLRVALHAGVVTRVPDPISGGFSYVGRATSRAARIEPIACEGQVYCSGTYAALLALENPHDLTLNYVGMRTLPKDAGTIPIFMLERLFAPGSREGAALLHPRIA